MEPILIIGAGRQAKVAIDVALATNQFHIEAVFDDDTSINEILGITVTHDLEKSVVEIGAGIVAIGNNPIREEVVKRVLTIHSSFRFVQLIHPSASISPFACVGPGSIIMPNVCVNSDASVGGHCILNTGCSIDHDGIIEDYVNISPGATLAGSVTLSKSVFVGTGALFAPDVVVGKDSKVGMGSVVLTDVPSKTLVVGNPAEVKGRVTGED